MKKIILILCLCLFTACVKEVPIVEEKPKEEKQLVTSEIYLHSYTGNLFTPEEFYPLRLKVIQESEFEKVILVHNGENGLGEEITITDPTELEKIQTYFQGISCMDETADIGSIQKIVDFEITLKGKDPLYLRIADDFFASENIRLLFHSDQSIHEMINQLNGSVKEVYQPETVTHFMSNQLWSDRELVEVPLNEEQTIPNQKIIEDLWIEYPDPLMNTLRITNYIYEEFDHWSDIKDVNNLVAGLIQQAPQYNCFETDENVCVEKNSGDLFLFPEGKPKLRNFVPDVYSILPKQTVIDKGKELFGDDFTFPKVENGMFAIGNYQSFDWLGNLNIFAYHTPYEVWNRDVYGMYLLNKEETNDVVSVELLRFKKILNYFDDFEATIGGIDGFEITKKDDFSEAELEQILLENMDRFEQWEYQLRKTEVGYQILSARLLDPHETVLQVQGDKGIVCFDDTNDVHK